MNFITGMMVHLHLLFLLWYTMYEADVYVFDGNW